MMIGRWCVVILILIDVFFVGYGVCYYGGDIVGVIW